MDRKSILKIWSSEEIMMGTNKLKQPLPLPELEHADPFLLLHHIGPEEQKPEEAPILDVGAHPHREFEPVSFIFSGELHHRDSRGNDSVIKAGGVQWITAGMGIVHSEQLPTTFLEQGGKFEMIQLWINLPQQYKMVQPNYQGFEESDIPTFYVSDEKGRLNIIAGQYQGLKGPIDSLTGITAYTLELLPEGNILLNFKADEQVLIYQLRGTSKINDQKVEDFQLVQLALEGKEVSIATETEALFLIVAGTPFKEPIVSWGPYVMNTQTEILQAMRDYQMGKMGVFT